MKPVQKALRAPQYDQFNVYNKSNSIFNLLKSNVGQICEEQTVMDHDADVDLLQQKNEHSMTDQNSSTTILEGDEHREFFKQISLDLSSTNRNIVTLSHKNARKLTRKSTIAKAYEDMLLDEKIGPRQVVGLVYWNNILEKESIPQETFALAGVSSKFILPLYEDTFTSDEENNTQHFGTTSENHHTTEDNHQ